MQTATTTWADTTSITNVIETYLMLASVSDMEIDSAVRGEQFDGSEVIASIAAPVVTYEEKHFDGPSMSDDEWSSL